MRGLKAIPVARLHCRVLDDEYHMLRPPLEARAFKRRSNAHDCSGQQQEVFQKGTGYQDDSSNVLLVSGNQKKVLSPRLIISFSEEFMCVNALLFEKKSALKCVGRKSIILQHLAHVPGYMKTALSGRQQTWVPLLGSQLWSRTLHRFQGTLCEKDCKVPSTLNMLPLQ